MISLVLKKKTTTPSLISLPTIKSLGRIFYMSGKKARNCVWSGFKSVNCGLNLFSFWAVHTGCKLIQAIICDFNPVKMPETSKLNNEQKITQELNGILWNCLGSLAGTIDNMDLYWFLLLNNNCFCTRTPFKCRSSVQRSHLDDVYLMPAGLKPPTPWHINTPHQVLWLQQTSVNVKLAGIEKGWMDRWMEWPWLIPFY